MDQGDAVVCAAVLQHRFLIPQRDLKLALGFIMRNGIAIHAALRHSFSRFYANAGPPDVLFFWPLLEKDLLHQLCLPTHQVSCSSLPLGSATTSLTGHEPARHAS